MENNRSYRAAVLSVLKHDYVARGMASHPRFELVVVADDPQVPAWAHERNQQFADAFRIPYVQNVERALNEFSVDVAIVSPEGERHCDLSIRAAKAGKHVVQDKPLATKHADAQRLVETIRETGVRFLLWNRNCFPAIVQAKQQLDAGVIGRVRAIHVDFYFAKDAGPVKGSRVPGYPPLDWQAHQIASHIDGSDGGLGSAPMGELAIEGIYPLGYIQMLTGAKVQRVFARSTAHFHQLYVDNGVEDLASLTLEMEGGIVGSVALGRIGLASHPNGGEIKLHIVGERGALVVNDARPDVGIYYRNQPPKEPRRRRVANDNDFHLAESMAQAIDGTATTIMDIEASMAIYETTEAAAASCRLGQPVDVS